VRGSFAQYPQVLDTARYRTVATGLDQDIADRGRLDRAGWDRRAEPVVAGGRTALGAAT
jgi:hypothetical protein